MTRPKLLIRDLTLRDGQQSLFATRMKQETINRLLPYYEDARFHIMEVWGGAVPDSVMRYLDESPWQRLRTFSEAMDSKSDHPKALLSALSRAHLSLRTLSRFGTRRFLQGSDSQRAERNAHIRCTQ